jgi:hypothetical protein
MTKKTMLFLFILAALLGMQSLPVQAQASGPYDVIQAVNEFRTSKGFPALQIDGSLMAAAQSQSDYQAAIRQVTHIGANGSHAKDRAIAAGFGGGRTVFVSENIAGGINLSINAAIYNYWQDALHLSTMLNPAALYIGAGMAKAGDYVYYTVDTGYWSGAPGPETTPPPAGVTPIPPGGNPADPFILSTPRKDGAIIHIVAAGQSLIGIANTYKVSVAEVLKLNNMSLDDVIFPGDEIILRAAFTPTVTSTPTDVAPSATPTASRTPKDETPTPWPTRLPQTETPSPTVTPISITISEGRQSVVVVVVLISLVALLAVIAVGVFGRK